jgi:hypothetical protein
METFIVFNESYRVIIVSDQYSSSFPATLPTRVDSCRVGYILYYKWAYKLYWSDKEYPCTLLNALSLLFLSQENKF